MANDIDPDLDLDRYEAWYAAKLWNLLPAIYRAEDSTDFDRRGPLEELVARVGAQAAIVRRSIDRLWEDQSIETCDDWVIAYLGDLLATNLVASLDARGQRVDVAKTIRYRRRKGTVGLLEELATDITGWSARVVEFSQRLGRTRHGLDPAIGLPVRPPDPTNPAAEVDPRYRLQRAQGLIGARTRTGAGGLADLRHAQGAAMTNTAFDEYFHTADVRRGQGATGWHDIPRLGAFVWRLKSQLVEKVTPVQDTTCVDRYRQYTFDPTGRDIPLFAAGERPFGDEWVSPQPHQMPGPITAELLRASLADLYPRSLGLYLPPAIAYALIRRDEIAAGAPWIDPERGRIIWPVAPGDFRVDYHYGFSSEIGAGAYERPVVGAPAGPSPSPIIVSDPDHDTIQASGTAVVVIDNSLTYGLVADFAGIDEVTLRAKNRQRPLIRPIHPDRSITTWIFTGSGAAALTLDGLFVSGGCEIVFDGSFDQVTLSCCTLDPGSWNASTAAWRLAADQRPLAATRLRIRGSIRQLVIDRCITGPIFTDGSGRMESLAIRDSIVQAADAGDPEARAIALTSGQVSLSRCTLLGQARVHRLDASECILDDIVTVDDRQHGCVRFSACPEGSKLPRQYESVRVQPRAGLFASRDFGQPQYAQLRATASGAISAGAEDGSEMGAFWREKNAVKERSLLIKFQEYLPLGLEPVIVNVT